jgi:hypothetical protein
MKSFLSLTRTVVTQATSIVLAVIEQTTSPSTTPKKRKTSIGLTTESDQAQILELFQPRGLAGIHDQQDEANHQQAILIARFYDYLTVQGMPDDLIFDLVSTKFQKMQFDRESMTLIPWEED